MAEHVWSVLCEKLAVDDENNTINLLTIIERITLVGRVEDINAELGASGFLSPMRLITWCVRSDYRAAESFELRVGWSTPGGEYVPLNKHRLEMAEEHSVRARLIVPGIPWRGVGLYWLVVDKNDSGEWVNAARLPVEVLVTELPKLASSS